jgi:hypothetical protein
MSDEDDPELKELKIHAAKTRALYEREKALTMHEGALENFDFAQSRITSLLKLPNPRLGSPDVASPISEALSCEYGVTYNESVRE